MISVDGMRGPRDGEEEAAEDERGVRHIGAPSKEALDKFTQFGEAITRDAQGRADGQTCRSTMKNTEWQSRLTRICA